MKIKWCLQNNCQIYRGPFLYESYTPGFFPFFKKSTQKNMKNIEKRAPAPPVNLDSMGTGKHNSF